MKKFLTLCVLAGSLLALSSVAKADQLFNFSYVDTTTTTFGAVISASGTLTTSDLPINISGSLWEYQITGITGVRNMETITGLVPATNWPSMSSAGDTPGSQVNFDNGLIVTPLGFDINGLYYTTANGRFNVYNDGSNWEYTAGTFNGTPPEYGATPIALTISSVPDSSATVALLGLGTLGLVAVRKVRDRRLLLLPM